MQSAGTSSTCHPSMQVRIVASMPCYSESNVDEQRGRGVFERSISGLRALNAAGYGQPGTGLSLDLVYNPNGAFLAPPTATLQVGATKLHGMIVFSWKHKSNPVLPGCSQCEVLKHRRLLLARVSQQRAAGLPSFSLTPVLCLLQAAYKEELNATYGITFNSLLCLNNMPIKRYVDYLQRRGQLQDYMEVPPQLPAALCTSVPACFML